MQWFAARIMPPNRDAVVYGASISGVGWLLSMNPFNATAGGRDG
jgi:hypothetical protein